MKAIRVHEVGGPEVLRLEELPDPTPGPGEAVVRVQAAGVNYIDTYHRSGLYPMELPFTVGLEGAGTVEAVGPGVDGVSPGNRVAWADAPGSYAEYVVSPAHRLVSLPDDVSTDVGAAIMLQGMTAHYLAVDTFPVRESSRVLIHAAAGGVGLLLTQICKLRGAYVFGTVSTPDKAKLAMEAGCDRAILYTEDDFADVIARETHGAGVDVVYDSVGRTTILRSMDCLRRRGMLVSFGQSSGRIEPPDPGIFSRKGSLFFTRPSLMHYVAEDEELHRRAGEVLEWVRSGRLQVRIGETWALDEAELAHRRLHGRLTAGKVLLKP
ncbi:MAG: quinone oxidoreductase family protein [Spirochaetota bacterium]